MAIEKVAVTKSKIVDVADAIREKAEIEDGLGLDDMPDVIRGIQTGAGFTISNANYLFYKGSLMDVYDGMMSLLKDVTSTEGMFYDCYLVSTLDLNKLDTTNVTNMGYMFCDCKEIKKLSLSHFNTSKVTTMNNMFCYCMALSELDLSSFDTPNLKSMNNMFFNCKSLKNLNISSFNTKNVTDMKSLFENCAELSELDLSSFNTSNVTNMERMFYGCTNLTSLDLSNFDTSSVTSLSCMMYNCKNLASFNMRNFDTSKVTSMASMFDGCTSLEEITGFSAMNKAGIALGLPYGTKATATKALKRLTFRTDLPEGTYSVRSAIYIKFCSFDREGMVEMFNTLPDVSTQTYSETYKKITITGNPCVVDGTLTEEDKAIATAKGWTLVI
jgi:surface protein